MEKSNEEIFITDWWLAPEFYLLRPIPKEENSRLDRVLLRAAIRGVKIKILLYWELDKVLGLNSEYTMK